MMKLLIVAISFMYLCQSSFGQEVKLGVPRGHNDNIEFVTYSSDGKLVASGSNDHTCKIWDEQSGKLIHNLPHNAWLNEAAFSHNNKLIATASVDSIVRIWDVSTGQIIHQLGATDGFIHTVAFDKNDEFLVVGAEKYVLIWNLQSGELVNKFQGPSKPNYRLPMLSRINHSNGTIITLTENMNTVNINSITNGELIGAIKLDHKSASGDTRLCIQQNGQHLAVSKNNAVSVYNIGSKKRMYKLQATADVNSIEFSRDNQFMVISSNSEVQIFDVATGNQVNEMHSVVAGDEVLYAAFSPTQNKVVVSITNWNHQPRHRMESWDYSEGKIIQEFKGLSEGVFEAYADDEDNFLLSTSNNGFFNIFSFLNGDLAISGDAHTQWNSKQVSDISSNYAAIANKTILTIYDLNNNSQVYTIQAHTRPINYLKFSTTGKYIVTIARDEHVKIWDTSSGKLVQDIKNVARSANFNSNDSKILIVGMKKNNVNGYNVDSGRELYTLNKHKEAVENVKISNDEKYIVTTSWDRNAMVWNNKNGSLIHVLSGHEHWVRALDIDNSSQLVATGSWDGLVKLWDLNSGKLLHTLNNHGSSIDHLSFSPDGQSLASGSTDASIVICDNKSGELKFKLTKHQGGITSLNYTADGRHIISSSMDGTTILWDARTGNMKLQLFVIDGDHTKWIHVTQGGQFDASAEAMDLMYWTKGTEVIEFSQLKDRYWVPGLWSKVMNGESLPSARGMSELRLQPEVSIDEMTEDNIPIHLTKRDGGYGKVSIFINGKEVALDVRGSELDTAQTAQTINYSIKDHPYLVNGNNTITVKASSADGFVQGRGTITNVAIKKEKTTQPQFFGVVIGIGDYANDNINLKYTVKDAEAISTSIRLGAENLFGEEKTHIYAITSNSEKLPTKDNIKAVFDEISTQAQAEDVIVVYLSGHGVTWGGDQGDFYFLTADATAQNKEAYADPGIRSARAISTNEWVEWLKRIPALKQVMIIDACGSGKAVDNLIAARDVEGSQIKAIDRMKDRIGMYIISGCTADAVSYEASQYGQGLLTYAILQAMKGAALKEDKFIDVFTMMDFARDAVPKLAQGIGGVQEPQLLIPKGGSFDIGILDTEDKAAIPLASPKTVFVRSTIVHAEEFEDVLGISDALDEALRSIATKGEGVPIVFFDAKKYPKACKISGGYTRDGNTLSLALKLRCGEVLQEFELKADGKEELIKEIIDVIDDKN
jgi:WD40 repeat protein